MAEISFKTAPGESEVIRKIIERAERDGLLGIRVSPGARTDLWMDVTAAHANGCPLDLEGLLAAEPFDFTHDLAGIMRHIDRRTGTLGDCFLPRYSARVPARADA